MRPSPCKASICLRQVWHHSGAGSRNEFASIERHAMPFCRRTVPRSSVQVLVPIPRMPPTGKRRIPTGMSRVGGRSKSRAMPSDSSSIGIDAGSLLVLFAGGVVVSASNTASPVDALAEADEDCPACAGTVSPRAFSLAKCSCEKRSVARRKSVALLRLDFNFSVASSARDSPKCFLQLIEISEGAVGGDNPACAGVELVVAVGAKAGVGCPGVGCSGVG